MLAQRRAAMMPHYGVGRIPALPAGDAGAQSQLGIVAIGEEVLVEAADAVEHGFAVHSRRAVRPEHLFFAIELTAVGRAGSPSAILSVGKDQVSGLIDAAGVFPYQRSEERRVGKECRSRWAQGVCR